MLMHAGAFGFYVVSEIVYAVCFSVYTQATILQNGTPKDEWLNFGNCQFMLTNFFSELFLAYLFWDLGRKEHVNFELESEGNLETADFDEDAELQARIWN